MAKSHSKLETWRALVTRQPGVSGLIQRCSTLTGASEGLLTRRVLVMVAAWLREREFWGLLGANLPYETSEVLL
ncbi:MAG: hypothetical protein JO363_16395 [Solirubrobacterales bacterium]|nr:hypothetical protein [Solirubrobacterales bacterium]